MGSPLVPNTFIGDYRVIDYVGAGGMGEVYRAVHSTTNRVVAVKVLGRLSENLTRRFFNEAQIQASLDHPNVAKFYEQRDYQGRPCIIMEYVEGETLSDRIHNLGSLPMSEVVFIMQAVLSALAYIHGRGVIHRDIKTNNIKVTPAGLVKLLDFGIARSDYSPKLTATGDAIGTLEYLAPELLKGAQADVKSDLWSVGVLLYEMVTGRAPFESPTLAGLIDKIMRSDFVPASTLNPSVSAELERIVSKCLKKKPSDRYQSVEELKWDIDRFAASVSSPRLSTQNRAKPGFGWFKSTKGMLAAGVAALIVIAVISIAVLLGGASQNDIGGPASSATRPVEVSIIDGTAQVYDNSGHFKSTTPYRFNARLGSDVKLVLKRPGYEDKMVEFKVGEENTYDGYQMDPIQKR